MCSCSDLPSWVTLSRDRAQRGTTFSPACARCLSSLDRTSRCLSSLDSIVLGPARGRRQLGTMFEFYFGWDT